MGIVPVSDIWCFYPGPHVTIDVAIHLRDVSASAGYRWSVVRLMSSLATLATLGTLAEVGFRRACVNNYDLFFVLGYVEKFMKVFTVFKYIFECSTETSLSYMKAKVSLL